MLPTNEDIYSIAQYVLDTMVNVQSELHTQEKAEALAGHVTGCIQISGAWQGAVILQSSEGFARDAASRMLCMEEADLTSADIQDSFAELTNMIGGNIKSQVPGPSYLSLPSVTTGADFDFRLVHSSPIHEVALEVNAEPLRILLCERNQEVAV